MCLSPHLQLPVHHDLLPHQLHLLAVQAPVKVVPTAGVQVQCVEQGQVGQVRRGGLVLAHLGWGQAGQGCVLPGMCVAM